MSNFTDTLVVRLGLKLSQLIDVDLKNQVTIARLGLKLSQLIDVDLKNQVGTTQNIMLNSN